MYSEEVNGEIESIFKYMTSHMTHHAVIKKKIDKIKSSIERERESSKKHFKKTLILLTCVSVFSILFVVFKDFIEVHKRNQTSLNEIKLKNQIALMEYQINGFKLGEETYKKERSVLFNRYIIANNTIAQLETTIAHIEKKYKLLKTKHTMLKYNTNPESMYRRVIRDMPINIQFLCISVLGWAVYNMSKQLINSIRS